MPIKGVILCGARCRTKKGNPCEQPGMKNGRCRMHGGVFYKRETHGNTTLKALSSRRNEKQFLKLMKSLNDELSCLTCHKQLDS